MHKQFLPFRGGCLFCSQIDTQIVAGLDFDWKADEYLLKAFNEAETQNQIKYTSVRNVFIANYSKLEVIKIGEMKLGCK